MAKYVVEVCVDGHGVKRVLETDSLSDAKARARSEAKDLRGVDCGQHRPHPEGREVLTVNSKRVGGYATVIELRDEA
jgi:hypothetical protein